MVDIFKGYLLFVVIVNYRLYSLCGINIIPGSVGSFRGQLIPANVWEGLGLLSHPSALQEEPTFPGSLRTFT